MKCLLAMLTFLLLCSLAPGADNLPQRGMCLSLHAKTSDYPYEKLVDEIADLGAESVLVIVAGYQENTRSQVISHNLRGVPSRATLIRVIRHIHKRGMSTLLLPIVLLHEVVTDDDWRGGIKPPSWDKWFEEYEDFITYYAKIAAETNVEVFSVGSELISTEVFRRRWLKVIRSVRGVYRGKLLYSSNWDHYEEVAFWDALDCIGMTSYYTLTDTKKPKLEELANAWRRIRDNIADWQKKVGKKVILTEVGYPSQDGCNKHPWNYYASEVVDLEEQALCFRAFLDVCGEEPMFSGIYIFEWWGEGGAKDFNYTPRAKPAEKVLRDWFARKSKQSKARTVGAPVPDGRGEAR